MGEKGNIADVPTGGHSAAPAQAAARPQDVGLGGQPGAAPVPPPPPPQAGGGGLLSDLADQATGQVTDRVTDKGLGIVKGRNDDDEET
jgi:hypothetical protein